MQEIPGAQELLIRQTRWEADDVMSLWLVLPDGSALPDWSVGAHIDLMLPPDIIRQYSLCSLPTSKEEWKIAVLKEPNSSGGSRYIHEALRPGMSVAVAGPRNNFSLLDAPSYLLIAGGIGVTPLLPMAYALEESQADWKMLYGGRRRRSMTFIDELTSFGSRVTVLPEDEFGLLDLRTAIDSREPDAAIYCCGPEALIAAVEAQCARSSRAAPHVERFNASPAQLADLEAESVFDTEFDLVIENLDRRFTIPKGRTIIQVLRENKVFVPTSCTEGYCGVCETEVISGIPDHRDEYLSWERRAANSAIMVCCSRSKTPELVVRFRT